MRCKKIILALAFLQFFVGYGQSFFSKGDWVKIAAIETGVYQISKSDLSALGFDVSKPKNIQLFGGDGRILPQIVGQTRFTEPQIVPHLLLDTGKYATNFVLYFYNEGAKEVSVENDVLNTTLNIYSDTVFYYLTVLDQEATQINVENSFIQDNLSKVVSRYVHLEKEEINLFTSGRKWLSDKMSVSDSVLNISLNVDDISSELRVGYNLVATSYSVTTYFDLIVGNNVLERPRVSRSNNGYGIKARAVTGDFIVEKDSIQLDSLKLKVSYDLQGDLNAFAYVDYFDFQYLSLTKELKNQDEFFHLGDEKNIKINSRTSNVFLWSLNLLSYDKQLIAPQMQGDSALFSLPDESLQLTLFNIEEQQKKPVYLNSLDNFDLSVAQSDDQLLILYVPILAEQAKELQEYKNRTGISTSISDVTKVFEQYGNGKKDISALRNYIKDFYDKDNALKYVILLGNCSYDYKDRIADNTNFIPVYQSIESYHNVQTYSSDDFYGFLDEEEGEWRESSLGNHTLNVSIGRLPASTKQEAQEIVSKIIAYEQSSELDAWKSNIIFVADDRDDGLHVDQANQLVDLVGQNAVYMHRESVFLDAFKRDNNSIETARDYLLKSLNEGAMFVNYTGHGSEYIWTEEDLLTIQDMKNLENKNKLPVFITATCEFGRYDDPAIKSGAEELLFAQNGAIALVTTTRPVYSSSNFTINKVFYNQVFQKDSLGKFKTLGDVFLNTKNGSLNSVYNRNFSLLGDPSLRLRLPNKKISLDSINGQIPSQFTDTIKPGSQFTIKGEILDHLNQKDSLFNGVMEIRIFEASENKITEGYGGQAKMPYQSNTGEIYKITVNIYNGVYDAEISLPVEISSSLGYSQLLFLAYSQTEGEALGSYNDLVIGGDNLASENQAPQIYIDSISNGFNDNYSSQVLLNLRFTDDKGILLSDHVIGKEASIVVNESYDSPIYITDLFKMCSNSSKEICANVWIPNLIEGNNSIEISVWNIDGLGAKDTLYLNSNFEVDLEVYPNPMEEVLVIEATNTMLKDEYQLFLQVHNLFGERVFDGEINMGDAQFINVKELKASELNLIEQGIYFYTLEMRFKRTNNNYIKKGKITKL